LSTFDRDFFELTGIFACAAPFLDTTCAHEAACVLDCTAESCATCTSARAENTCATAERTGACAAFYQGAQCVPQALSGEAAFCNPDQAGAAFGTWLRIVGQAYCRE
jgi:hypothetical protein